MGSFSGSSTLNGMTSLGFLASGTTVFRYIFLLVINHHAFKGIQSQTMQEERMKKRDWTKRY